MASSTCCLGAPWTFLVWVRGHPDLVSCPPPSNALTQHLVPYLADLLTELARLRAGQVLELDTGGWSCFLRAVLTPAIDFWDEHLVVTRSGVPASASALGQVSIASVIWTVYWFPMDALLRANGHGAPVLCPTTRLYFFQCFSS